VTFDWDRVLFMRSRVLKEKKRKPGAKSHSLERKVTREEKATVETRMKRIRKRL